MCTCTEILGFEFYFGVKTLTAAQSIASKDLHASIDSYKSVLKWIKSVQAKVPSEAFEEHSQKFSPSSNRSLASAAIASAGMVLSLGSKPFEGLSFASCKSCIQSKAYGSVCKQMGWSSINH